MSLIKRAIAKVYATTIVDIEAMLRCEVCEVWSGVQAGNTPPVFDRSGAEALNFGHRPLRCAAASWVPVAAALISGEISNEKAILEPGRCIGGMEWVTKSGEILV